MDVTLTVSLAFLVSPLLGYIIILLPLSTRQKLLLAVVSVILLIALSLAVIWLTGGGGSTGGDSIQGHITRHMANGIRPS